MDSEKVEAKYKVGLANLNLKVPVEKQQIYDQAVKNANEILTKYQEKYSRVSPDYFYSMTILELAVQLEDLKKKQQDNSEQMDAVGGKIAMFLKEMGK